MQIYSPKNIIIYEGLRFQHERYTSFLSTYYGSKPIINNCMSTVINYNSLSF